MYSFGQTLTEDIHFLDHMDHGIPVQVYEGDRHLDIGYVQGISREFVKIGSLYYNRNFYTFISRPGY